MSVYFWNLATVLEESAHCRARQKFGIYMNRFQCISRRNRIRLWRTRGAVATPHMFVAAVYTWVNQEMIHDYETLLSHRNPFNHELVLGEKTCTLVLSLLATEYVNFVVYC